LKPAALGDMVWGKKGNSERQPGVFIKSCERHCHEKIVIEKKGNSAPFHEMMIFVFRV
jgi:hypothetical protein